MGIFEGYIRIRILSPDLELTLSKLTMNGVELINIFRKDYLTSEITIQRSNIDPVRKILNDSGCKFEIIQKYGVVNTFQRIIHRPVLLLGLLVFVFLLQFLSDRIFFIHITGNESISDTEIRTQAELCGIGFGSKATEIRSENLKNALLQRIPDLQWVGVTTSGMVATIHVKEGCTVENKTLNTEPLGIYATKDGIISETVVRRGTPIVMPGNQVNAGDLLVSGYTDCGIKIRTDVPDGEIYAYTHQEIIFTTQAHAEIRGLITNKHRCFLIRVGKKVINFCNHSGIQTPTCVKMYSEEYLTLPGGFQLPVSIVGVTYYFYETETAEQWDSSAWMSQFTKRYLTEQMIAGEILKEELSWNSFHEVTGIYACHEMIGQIKSEENFKHNAEDH